MNNITRFDRATVQFTPNISVDGYRTPSGEFRVGMTGASTALGFASNWLSRATSRDGKALEALQGMGFTGYHIEASVARDGKSGASLVDTISLDDFCVLITYAVQQKKLQAVALNVAFLKIPITDFFRDAFGDDPLSMEEKRLLFYKAYSKAVNWLSEDRYDVRSLWLAGDPKEIRGWNNSVNWIE